MKVVILVCDLYVMSLASCTERNAAAVFEAPQRLESIVIDTYITARGTAYRERVKVLRK